LLLTLAPGGFQAFWSDPLLESLLLVVTVVALVLAAFRGAFRREPVVRSIPAAQSAEEGAWELSLELDRLGREERRILRAMSRRGRSPAEEGDLEERLRKVRAESRDLAHRREVEYGE